jgi:L-threonylcarbamoyladenylate synthase
LHFAIRNLQCFEIANCELQNANCKMKTDILAVDPNLIAPDAITRAAEVLRQGGLVAFPTETVYGLGANALDAAAVARIFEAKGRPANNPLIVHVGDAQAAAQLTSTWPQAASPLAERFWPGPLTLVLPKRPEIPDLVTAGGPTVALRVPAHPVALALLRAVGLPLAAPSANRSGELSPTRAEHVLRGLAGRLDLILDAGPTTGGIESTVLDLTTQPPRVLRPGLVTAAELERLIGPVVRTASAEGSPPLALPSPGLLARHYAPRTPLECLEGNDAQQVLQGARAGQAIGWVTLAAPADCELVPNLVLVQLPPDPAAYAAQLYTTLHQLDDAGLDRIVVSLPPDTEEWAAVRDRLRRAAHR